MCGPLAQVLYNVMIVPPDGHPITGECQREYYECSWWNGFCWLFCRSYDEVKYCNYCGNPSE